MSATLLIVVAFMILAVSISTMPVAVTQETTNNRSFTVGDLTVQGGVYRDDIRVEYDNGDAVLIYTGDAEDVYWSFKDNSLPVFESDGDSYTYRGFETVVGDTLIFTDPGYYDIKICTDGSSSEGLIVLDGDITQDYEWCRWTEGQLYQYTTTFTYSFSDYYYYAQLNTPRYHVGTMSDSRFVVVDDPILRLSAALKEEYESVHGEMVPGSQDYADYLLSFVQCCITYPELISWNGSAFVEGRGGYADLYLYGTEEYWAYPMETLYFGCGDCEDTAFLMSSLLSASGYLSALVMLPNHMLSTVMLEDFAPAESVDGYGNKPVNIMGVDMRVCETTFGHYVPLGYYEYKIESMLWEPLTYLMIMPYSGYMSR